MVPRKGGFGRRTLQVVWRCVFEKTKTMNTAAFKICFQSLKRMNSFKMQKIKNKNNPFFRIWFLETCQKFSVISIELLMDKNYKYALTISNKFLV